MYLALVKGAELGASIALELQGQVFAPIHDFRGNIVSIVDTTQALSTESYRYTAFGECEVYANHLLLTHGALQVNAMIQKQALSTLQGATMLQNLAGG